MDSEEIKESEEGRKEVHDLVGELGELPEPTETTGEDATPPQSVGSTLTPPVIPSKKETPTNSGGLVDTKGRSFDPDLHATDEMGNAIVTSKGKLKLLKRGRPSGGPSPTTSSRSPSQSVLNSPKIAGPEEIQDIQSEENARALGVYASTTLVTLGRLWGGDEWEPQKLPVDEKANLDQAFGDYFVANDMKDLPPGVALTVAILGYSVPRFFMPKTKERTLSLWDKAKLWNQARKMKKKKPVREFKKSEESPIAK